ncbi:INTS1 [Bugula neritina]|uniref:INTS1 n=1 Tax=Bugula neritina TaxID=10212 RepID=A0A7J7K1D8_BUGNE|nr:INTS1 [Bugula neritina]
MDKIRNSINAKRPGKPKGHNTPFDLIPLGQKSGEASKSKLLAAAKTDASLSAGSSLLVKKAKYGVPNKAQMKYDEMATDCLPPELYDKIEGESEPSEVSDKLLCGAVKHLRAQRAKPNHQIVLTLMTLAKDRPSLFTTDIATGAFCSLLKRDASANFKAKGNPTVTVLACNLLYTAYADEEHWPQQLVEVYLEDSLGERTWVDRADCKPLVNNIVTAFGTNLTPKNPSLVESSGYGLPSTSGAGASSSPSSSPFHHSSSPVDTGDDSNTGFSLGLSNAVVKHRYRFQMDSIEQLVMDTVTEQMTKRQHLEVTSKQLLRLLTSVSGYCAARLMVVNKLDSWLQNPKLMKAAQDLLLAVCLNCSGQNPNDKDVIVGLLKIRAKTKPVLSHYINCIRELLEADDENLRIVLTHTVYNELSTSRHPNNMQMLATMFQQNSELSPKLLADIFIDLLMTKEDYLRSLRALLREIVRAMRTDFTFHAFCVGLMANRSTHPVYLSLEQSAKERVMYGIADLVAVTELLTISPAVKEALGGSVSFTDKRKDASVIQTFWSQIANIQKTSVSWMYETFTSMLHVTDGQGFIQCLYKLLMMAHGEHYSKVDNWPTEADRKIMLRLASETPVLEDTLLRLLMMGMDGEYPLKASDALDVMELMVNRAAALKVTNYPALEIKNLDIVKLLLNVSTYHHPDNIKLPKGYRPPHLAIASMFWKSWLLILVLVAYNPTTFGKYVWKEYPTLEMLMEMVMTNRYLFPPVSSGTDMEQLVAQERQICELEKQEILEFEGHLAAATSNVTITETNSLLLSQLISMNASGPSRKPPAKIVEELKMLNSSLHLGHTLSKSRNPDFLLQVIQKQGTSNAMPWLSELVESSEGSLDVLPIQCLCEFLLMSNGDSKSDDPKAKHSQKIARHDRLLQRLQMIMQQPSDSGDGDSPAFQVISYFFERLYSTSPYTRDLSVKALRTMFVDPVTQQAMDIDINTDSNQFDWLHVNIPEISMFSSVEDLIQTSVQKALHVETDYEVVSAYITYLMESKMYRKEPSLTILEISKMLCSRPALCNQLLSHSETYDMLILSFKHFTEDAIARKSAFEWHSGMLGT